MKSFIISFLMYLHQLPQNIIGFLLILYYKGEDEFVRQGKNDVLIRFSARMLGGVSLGQYVIVGRHSSKTTWEHELGHCLQSQKTRVDVPARSRYPVNPVGVDLRPRLCQQEMGIL